MKAREYRAKFIAQAKNNVVEARRALKKARAAAALGSRVAVAAEKIAGATYCFAGASGQVYVSVSLQVDGFKDAKLVKLLAKGLDMLGADAKCESHDYPDANLREYKIIGNGVALEVSARPVDNAMASCYRRQIGVKQVEVAQYEFVCN